MLRLTLPSDHNRLADYAMHRKPVTRYALGQPVIVLAHLGAALHACCAERIRSSRLFSGESSRMMIQLRAKPSALQAPCAWIDKIETHAGKDKTEMVDDAYAIT